MDSITKMDAKIQTVLNEGMAKMMGIDVLEGLGKNSEDFNQTCGELFLALWRQKVQETR